MNNAGAGDKVVIHAPRGAIFVIERAAIQAHMTPGDFARRLLTDGLRASGFELAEAGPFRTAEVLSFDRP